MPITKTYFLGVDIQGNTGDPAGSNGLVFDRRDCTFFDPSNVIWRESGAPFGSAQTDFFADGNKNLGDGGGPPGARIEQAPAGSAASGACGFTVNQFGLAGVPTELGVFTGNFDASGAFGGDSYTITISLLGGCPLITISPTSIDDQFVGDPGVAIELTAEDGVAPYTWDVAAGELPPGLALGAGDGIISGTPTTAGTYTFTARATDDNGCPGVRVYSITVVEPDPVEVLPADSEDPYELPGGNRDEPYTFTFTAIGGIGEPYTFSSDPSDGELPEGLELSPAGVLSGRPLVAGRFRFVVEAIDEAENFGTREYELDLAGIKIVIGGVDVSREVEAADLELGLNRQATGNLTIGDGYIPDRAADVLIFARDGVTPIFGGLVLVRSIDGMTPSNPANKGAIDLVDYSVFFDDADPITIVSAVSQALEDVIAAIVSQALAAYGITYDEAPTGQTVPPIEWNAIQVSDAFKRITDATGVVFRVDPLKALKVFTPLDDPAPTAITDALLLSDAVAFDLSWRDPAGLPKNTVDLTCGPTGNGVATQRWEGDGVTTEFEVDIQAVIGNAEPAHTANAYLSPVGATNFSDGDTIGLGSSTYTFRASLVGDVAGEVLIGASVTDSLANLNAAINLAGGGVYAPSTPANADAFSFLPFADRLEARALVAGAAGNAIAVSSSHEAIAFWYGEGGIPRSTFQLGSDATGVAGWTQGYVLEDPDGEAVARTISNFPDTSAYYVWNVTDGRGTISVGDTGATPAEYLELELKYLAVFPFHAIVTNGTPPRTFREAHPEIISYAAGIALATQILARESADRRELEVFTDVDGFLPGQALTVNTTKRGGIVDLFLVATVRIRLVNAELWEYSATCQETDQYAGSYVEQWKALTSGGGSSAAAPATLDGGGATVAGDIYSDGRQSFRADQSMGGHKLTFVDDPAADADAANKGYVDTAAAAALYDANAYTDAGLVGVIRDDGSVPFAADQSMGGNKLTDLDDPTAADDAATKAYVDSQAGGGSGDHGFFAVGGGAYDRLAAGPITLRPTGTTLTFIVGIGLVNTGDSTVYANVQLTDVAMEDARAVVNNSLINIGGQQLFGLVHITGLTAGKDYVAGLYYSSRRAVSTISGVGKSSPFLIPLDFVTAIVAASLETAEASSSATFTDLATAGPSVSITVGSDGVVAVIAGDSENRVQTGTSNLGIDVSGATTAAAESLCQQSTNGAQNCAIQCGMVLARQASGSTTYKLQYQSDGGSNTRYARWIAAMLAVFGDTPITFGVSKVETPETTNSTTYVGLTTADTITITTGTSVLVLFSVNFRGSGVLDASVAVDVSGATTIAAADGVSNAKNIGSTTQTWHVGRGVVLTVNAGSNTFKLKYKVSANTGTFLGRVFVVIPLN